MCNKPHSTTEETLRCRDEERSKGSELYQILLRGQNIELALSDLLRLIERAKSLNDAAMIFENEGIIDQAQRALK